MINKFTRWSTDNFIKFSISIRRDLLTSGNHDFILLHLITFAIYPSFFLYSNKGANTLFFSGLL